MTFGLTTTSSGAVADLTAAGHSLVLYPATELEAGPANLWLRRRADGGVRATRPLTGPASGGTAYDHDGRAAVEGYWEGLQHRAWFDVHDEALGWCWEVTNTGTAPEVVDLLCLLDAALAPMADVRRSEYYVSQYLDLTPVDTQAGPFLAVRQNMPGQAQPWVALGSTEPVVGWCTDALQLRDRGAPHGLDTSLDLPSVRLQHEHTLAGLQLAPMELGAGEVRRGAFWLVFRDDHPGATGSSDAALVAGVLDGIRWAGWPVGELPAHPVAATLFDPAVVASCREVPDVEPSDLRLVERDTAATGLLLSGHLGIGADAVHVVTGAKEHRVLRPHGQLMHHSPGPTADGRAVASTAWMAGTFASQLTVGQASAHERLTIARSYLGLLLAHGLRLFVGSGHDRRLLTVPTLWSVGPQGATWRYELDGDQAGRTVEVGVSLVGTAALDVSATITGPPVSLLFVLFEAHDGVDLRTDGLVGDDAPLFLDRTSRGLRARTVSFDEVVEASLRLGLPGSVDESPHRWAVPQLESSDPEVEALAQYLHHLARDAAVHYQAPRGLEQYTGGAWGVRDVCQGPVGLLLATDETAALRDTLLKVYAGQQDDGDWPQWFHFLDEARFHGHRESHGDVVYWPLLALAEYLQTSGDVSILDEPVAFVTRTGFTAPMPLREHVERAVARLAGRRTRDQRLPAYGHGDWNDSLQPARPELADQMCSTWTTELEVQALESLADAVGPHWAPMAAEARDIAARTREAFGEVLLADGELAGYAVLGQDVELLVHPRDERTGLVHGSLQMIHALSGELLSPEDARHHLQLVTEHLSAPSGTYLFDRPVPYSGGERKVFQRAEAATFWGREIGLMYTHAHLRFVEALAVLGEADRSWAELAKVVPIGLAARHPGARLRQSNCYYSSSDTAFADRHQASEQRAALFDDTMPCEGGWRVYSSGPGLMLRIVRDRLLGLRPLRDGLVVDPVIPPRLDGLRVRTRIAGLDVGVTYRVGAAGCGAKRVLHEGVELPVTPLRARYRTPGVRLDVALTALAAGRDRLELEVYVG